MFYINGCLEKEVLTADIDLVISLIEAIFYTYSHHQIKYFEVNLPVVGVHRVMKIWVYGSNFIPDWVFFASGEAWLIYFAGICFIQMLWVVSQSIWKFSLVRGVFRVVTVSLATSCPSAARKYVWLRVSAC